MQAEDLDDVAAYAAQVGTRLDSITRLASEGGLDRAITLLAECIERGGVIHAFGTGHSEAFAMEIAGRAGGLIPTNKVALRDTVLYGQHTLAELGGRPPLERDPHIAEDLFATINRHPEDVFVIASNSGVNGSVVGLALLARQHGHRVIAVTSLEHTARVSPRHPSGQRLADVADVVIDNLAPYGDSTLTLPAKDGGVGIGVGAVSSVTAAFIAQVITIDAAQRLQQAGATPPVYVSANVPGGDEHNQALEDLYRGRIRRLA